MWNDVMVVISWWIVWWLLGVVSLPVTNLWLDGLWDRGYSLAKVLGWVVVGYVAWLGASMGVWDFGSLVVWGVLGTWILINLLIFNFQFSNIREVVRNNWRVWLRLELLFLAAMVFWAMVRGYQPDINGLEKFMDFGFMQSVLQSSSFPPHDMWFAGGSINYYYFGHYLSAVMTMISGIKPAVAYNLMIATLFGLSVSGAVAVGGSLIKYQISSIKYQKYGTPPSPLLPRGGMRWVVVGGLLAAFLFSLRGNLHTAGYQVNKWLGQIGAVQYLQIGAVNVGDKKDFACQTGVNWLPCPDAGYWYPDATRYIPFTIHEFPIYSFVVADLHAHVINIPIVLLFLGLLVTMVIRIDTNVNRISTNVLARVVGKAKGAIESRFGKSTTPGFSSERRVTWWEVLVLGWLLGVFAMTNAWDVPIYGIVLGVTLAVLEISNIKYQKYLAEVVKQLFWIIQRLAPVGIGLVFLALVASLPFQLNFIQIAEGVLRVNTTSAIYQLLILWGWDLFLFLSLVIFILSRIFNFQYSIFNKKIIKLTGNWKLETGNLILWDWIILSWYGVGWLLIVLPEIIYVKDIYIADYHRANTMFKLVYQSWMLFAIGGSYTIIRILTSSIKYEVLSIKYIKWVWVLVMIVGLVAVGSYPGKAIKGYYGEMKDYKGLDGEAWLAAKHPDDYKGIEWLRNKAKLFKESLALDQAPVVLEAVGDSYTEFNRVSAYTGLPTVEGWLVHEWLWRGAYDMPGARNIAVEHIYKSETWDEKISILNLEVIGETKEYTARELLDLYNVRYVFVGDKEKEKYPELVESKFTETGEVVFESRETRIYKIN